jgi:putative oxidoreductase
MVSAGLLLIRLFVGFGLAAHGFWKISGDQGLVGFAGFLRSLGVPRPELAAYLSAWTELMGGFLVGVGLYMRPAALALAFNMFVAVWTVHRSSYFITNDPPGMEYALNLGVVFLALVLTGPGKYSVDVHFFSRRPSSPPPPPKS